MRKLLWTIGLAVALGATGGPAGAQDLKEVTFLTNYVFHGRHSPYFVGLDKGFYKDSGFDIKISPATGSGFVVSAVEGGKADYGMADASTVVQAIGKGAKVKAFMVFMDVTTSGLASLKPYQSPESLKGATIAASLTDSARVILPIIYDLKGLDTAGLKWQAADPGVYASLLFSGQVDLITASIDGDVPALARTAKTQGKSVHFASWAKWGYDVFGYFLVTTPERVAKNPGEVRRFADATAAAVRYSIENPEETAKIMVEHNANLNYDTTLAQWSQSIKAIDTDFVRKHGYGAATQDRLQRTIDLVDRALKLEKKPTPADAFALELAKN